jgi:hypothetical protein
MELDIRVLRSFRTVPDARTFTGAARRLNLTQSTVSQQVMALEKQLGAVLLKRSNRFVGLTTAGEIVLHCTRLLGSGRGKLPLQPEVGPSLLARVENVALPLSNRFAKRRDRGRNSTPTIAKHLSYFARSDPESVPAGVAVTCRRPSSDAVQIPLTTRHRKKRLGRPFSRQEENVESYR